VSTPSISVLTVTYNSEDHLPAFLEVLLPELDSCGGELILVDNASTDATRSLIQNGVQHKAFVKIIENRKNLGFAIANNQALAIAEGTDILLLNPDTAVETGAIQGLLESLHESENRGAVAPQLRFSDGRIQRSCRRFPTHLNILTQMLGLGLLFPRSRWANGWKMGDFDHEQSRDVDQPAAAALLIRGDLYRELEGLNEQFPMFFNDVDLCRRIHQRGYRIRFDARYRVIHAGGGSVRRRPLAMVVSSQLSFFRYFERSYTGLLYQVPNLLLGMLLYLAIIPRILFHFLPRRKGRRDVL